MLIASLVPEVRSLKDLTAGRLVQLNHGTLRAPIPGTEAQMAAQRLQKWASMVGQIHVGPQADPLVWVTLGTVDLGPIIDQASEADNAGAKQNIVRAMLFSEMGLEVGREWGEDRVIEWNSTKRLGHVRFGNVRRMGEEQLRCPEDHAFRIVIDYPFDDPGFGPNDDLEVVDRVREEGGGSWSLVWLPSFFSEQINKIVGELAKLDHILATRESARHYVAHLRVDQQQPVITDLENLRSQKRARLRSALLQAYGIARQTEGDIDPTRSVTTHLHVLKSDLRIQPLSGGTLHGVVEHYAGKLLELRYPRHPAFPHKLTKQTCERVLEHFSDLVDSEDKRLTLAKDDVGKLRETLGLLGIVSTTETAVHLVEDRTLQLLEQKRAQKAIDHPSVDELRAWLDENGKMGLTFEANDLVVRAYARWSARTFVRYGSPFVVTAGSAIPGDVVLEKPELPSQAEWSAAIELAGHAFGLTLPRKSLFADNVKRFEAELEKRASELSAKASRLAAVVASRAAELGLPADVDRARTAQSAQALCAAVKGKKGPEQVRALAAFKAETSPKAVGASLASAASVAQSLENRLVFGVFGQLAARPDLGGAAALLDDLRKALRQDELHVTLTATLETLALRAQDLLRSPEAEPPPPPVAGPDVTVVVDEGLPRAPTDAARQLARWLSLLSAELEAGHDVTIEGRLRITRKG